MTVTKGLVPFYSKLIKSIDRGADAQSIMEALTPWKLNDEGLWELQTDQALIGKGAIVKKVDDQQLVFGWANVIKHEDGRVLVDRQKDYCDDEAELEKAAYDYVVHSRDGGDMHIRKGVSDLVESMVFTPEKTTGLGLPYELLPTGWFVGFHVNDSDTWSEVRKEEYVMFSVHGAGVREQTLVSADTHTTEGA